MENRLKMKIAAIDAKFTKMLDRTDSKLEAMRSSLKNHMLAAPALTVSKKGLIELGRSPTKAYRSQSAL